MADENLRQPVTVEVATVEKDIDIFSGWLTRLENPDAVLRSESAGRGVRLYEELIRDWQVFSQLQVRAGTLQSCEWQVEPASDRRADTKIADFVQRVLKEANYDRLSTDLMQAVLTGYKPVEIMWEISGSEVWIREFRGRRPSRFVFDIEGNLRLLTPQNTWDGEALPLRKFIVWAHGGHDHNPYGLGLGHQLYWPVWFKKNGVKFWMVFAEKFGSPTVIGKYPAGTADADKDKLLDAISAIQQQTGIRVPDTMVIDLLEAARTGTVTYGDLCNYFDRAISKILLGQTLTREPGDSGSYGLGKVHDGVRQAVLKADADSMCEMLNRTVVRWLVDYNFPAEGRTDYPRVWRRTEPETDLVALANRDKVILVDMGFGARVPESYISDTYALPLAQPGEAVIGVPQRAQPGMADGMQMSGAQSGAARDKDAGAEAAFAEHGKRRLGQADLDRMAAAAAAKGQDAIAKLLKPALDFVEKAKSLEEIGEHLYGLYPQLDSARFQELLTRAMFASSLIGYGASRQESSDD
ncbi:MAG: DUF935 domain-containing protein [Desulfobacteraceae bacterium]|nr:DUF935 domain-containing protein [Desulfobacteraceae bacterium]